MKKMSFNEAMSKNVMTASQMKRINGGSGTCGVAIWSGDSWMTGCNMKKQDAINSLQDYSGPKYWCCDSCGSTFYCGK